MESFQQMFGHTANWGRSVQSIHEEVGTGGQCGMGGGLGVKTGGGREGGTGVGTDGREGGRDVMAIMKLVHMAWNGCKMVNPSACIYLTYSSQ